MEKKMLLRIKSLLLLSSSIATISLTSSSKSHIKPTFQFDEIDETHAIINYQNGYAYLGNYDYLTACYNVDLDAIYICDERSGNDPNIKIFESYLINSLDDQEAILNALLEYEKRYPTDWNRSLESMQFEWFIHNLLFNLYIERNRTGNVDLNNADQNVYLLSIK